MLYLAQAVRGVFIPRRKQRELSSAVFIDNLSQGWKGLDGVAVAYCASGGGRIEADPLTGDPTKSATNALSVIIRRVLKYKGVTSRTPSTRAAD